MPEYTLKLRRYSPETGEAAYWESFNVELEPQRSVLEGILQARNQQDGSIGIRCSCRAAICGSCGVMINGKAGLACHTHLSEAARDSETNEIVIEPFNNMPVIKDLVVDMDAVHWAKQHRVTPWLINKEPVPEKEYIVPHENMVDVTQSMACIQCGCCNAACLSMEVDPLLVGPAAPPLWWSARCSSARPPPPRPTGSSATRATLSMTRASRTSPRTPTACTTA